MLVVEHLWWPCLALLSLIIGVCLCVCVCTLRGIKSNQYCYLNCHTMFQPTLHWASDLDTSERKEEGHRQKSHSRLLRNLLAKWQKLIKKEITWCSNTCHMSPWRGTQTRWITYNRASSSYLNMNKGNTMHILSLCRQQQALWYPSSFFIDSFESKELQFHTTSALQ